MVGKNRPKHLTDVLIIVGFFLCFRAGNVWHMSWMFLGNLFWGERYKTLVVLYWETFFCRFRPVRFSLGRVSLHRDKMLLASRLETGIIIYAQSNTVCDYVIECHSSMSPTIPFFKTSRCRDRVPFFLVGGPSNKTSLKPICVMITHKRNTTKHPFR